MIPLAAFVRLIARPSRKIFERDGGHVPVFLGVTAAGEMCAMGLPKNKNVAAAAMRLFAVKRKLVRCVLISEVWVIEWDSGESVTIDDFNRLYPDGLEHVPGRHERLLFSAEDYDSGLLTAWCDILRPPGGRPELGPLRIDRSKESVGRYASFLPPRGTRQ